MPEVSCQSVQPQRTAGRVLIVDDSPGMRLYLSTILSTLGMHVVEAEDGKAAFDEVISESFDLVITDLLMAKTDGFQLVSAISQMPDEHLRPSLIVCTGLEGHDEEMQRPELDSVSVILQKPIDASSLAGAVMKALAATHTASGN